MDVRFGRPPRTSISPPSRGVNGTFCRPAPAAATSRRSGPTPGSPSPAPTPIPPPGRRRKPQISPVLALRAEEAFRTPPVLLLTGASCRALQLGGRPRRPNPQDAGRATWPPPVPAAEERNDRRGQDAADQRGVEEDAAAQGGGEHLGL